MNAESYDTYLATLATDKDWERIPEKDVLLYTYFGTVAPRILRRPHRLLTSDSRAFQTLMSVLGDCGATIGKPMPILDFNGEETPYEEVCAWKQHENQEWLIAQIMSMKFEEHRNIIFSASLSEKVVQDIASSTIILGRWGNTSARDWFDAIDEKLNELGWVYSSLLSETIMLDLLVLKEEYASSYLHEIDMVFAQHHWVSKPFLYQGDRWVWPD